MAINFPTSLDSLTNPISTDRLNSPDHAVQHENANDIVEALEAKVGIDNSAVTTSLDYLVKKYKKIEKTTDETKTSDNTTADDTVLKFSVAANTKYRFVLQVFYYSGATPDFKYQFTGPASPTVIGYRRETTAHGASTVTNSLLSAYISTDASITVGTSGIGQIRLWGILHNGANAGTVAFAWAQNTSDASNTTVYAGSFIEYSIV